MPRSLLGRLSLYAAALVATVAMAGTATAQQRVVVAYPPATSPGYVVPRSSYYNPVGFGFGGYSYGSYPAYGYNAYLPSVYAGFNTPGVAAPAPGGTVYYRASDAYDASCGPTGCRLNYYRGW